MAGSSVPEITREQKTPASMMSDGEKLICHMTGASRICPLTRRLPVRRLFGRTAAVRKKWGRSAGSAVKARVLPAGSWEAWDGIGSLLRLRS